MPDNARDFTQRTEVGPLTLQELLQGLGDVFAGRGMSPFKSQYGTGLMHRTTAPQGITAGEGPRFLGFMPSFQVDHPKAQMGVPVLEQFDLRDPHDKGTGKTQQQGFVKQGDFYYKRGISPSGVVEYGKVPYKKKGKDFVPVKEERGENP